MSVTCALCRRVIPDEQIPYSQIVQEHLLRREEQDSRPTVMLSRPQGAANGGE